MRYLLDTNILSVAVRQPHGSLAMLLARRQLEVMTSVVVAAELRFGAAKARSTRLAASIEEILSGVPILPFESPADETYATLRADLERRGRPLAGNDLLIAAHALTLGSVLVTADAAFGDVPGLVVENWLT